MRYILFALLLYCSLGAEGSSQNGVLSQYTSSKLDFIVDIYRAYTFIEKEDTHKEDLVVCKGAIINSHRVLTTANCLNSDGAIYETPYRNLGIKYRGKTYTINHIFTHNDYTNGAFHNLAILELDEPISLPSYPKIASKGSIEKLIKEQNSIHLLFQDENNAIIQSVRTISNQECEEELEIPKGLLEASAFCMLPKNESVTICPAFRGTPLIRILENDQIELIGLVPSLFAVNGCLQLPLFIGTNISEFEDFFIAIRDTSYRTPGHLTRGFIKSLETGWHFLGTEESLDMDLSYVFEYAKVLSYYDNKSNSYRTWIKENGKWDGEVLVPARSGFWLKR